MQAVTIGFAMCGSFCTFKSVLEQMQAFVDAGANVVPIMSHNAYSIDTRFGKAADFASRIESMCSNHIIHTIAQAEPIGPKKLLDALVIAPCTGNTLAKLATGVTDTSVTLAAKAHLRNARPVIIAVSTNDALAAASKNIGLLLNTKNIFMCPMRQDDPEGKPTSIVADFTYLLPTCEAALEGRQIQPIYCR